ncbi:pentapeptide repeat-containing protein [Sulfurimonas sp. SAG-AH-194-C21]|nr:pentapeptide repeat-containing protein [Sulfurimonas sp. SAG-AH-194-C21]MDF1882484.1 pentapeptide repeat-containing protein [Sulfurimonas sp. SAG-AH-194-C21]
MANAEHKKIVEQGVHVWNKWREDNPGMIPNLNGIDLSGQDWSGANFTRTDFVKANFEGTNLENAIMTGAKDPSGVDIGRSYFDGANFRNANLNNADLRRAILIDADLTGATLLGANLSASDLTNAIFVNARLKGANLIQAQLIKTNFDGANLDECLTYGISTWDLSLEKTQQSNLLITPPDSPVITVDNIQVAQFIYLLLNNKEIRNTIVTITSKAVLILGRFTEERKPILDEIRNKLRMHNYLPIMFDFEKAHNRDLTETITTLAGLSRFIIADLTDPKSIPHELKAIVANLPSVPVQPIILKGQTEYAMFEHFTRYPWVLDIYKYANRDELIGSFYDDILLPIENKLIQGSTLKTESIYDSHIEKIEELCKIGLSINKLSQHLDIGTPKSLTLYIKSRGIKKYVKPKGKK